MTPYQFVMNKCKKFNKTLTAGMFDKDVRIQHEDGSYFHIRNAFIVKTQDNDNKWWICVFPEHYPILIFSKDDLTFYEHLNHRAYDPLELESMKLVNRICNRIKMRK